MSFLVVFITAYLQRDHLNDTLSSWWFINMATYFALRCWEPAVDWRHPKITTWNVCMKNPIYKYREKWDKLWPGAGISSSMEKKAWSDAFSWSFAEDPIKNQKKNGSYSCLPLKTTWSKLLTEQHGSTLSSAADYAYGKRLVVYEGHILSPEDKWSVHPMSNLVLSKKNATNQALCVGWTNARKSLKMQTWFSYW